MQHIIIHLIRAFTSSNQYSIILPGEIKELERMRNIKIKSEQLGLVIINKTKDWALKNGWTLEQGSYSWRDGTQKIYRYGDVYLELYEGKFYQHLTFQSSGNKKLTEAEKTARSAFIAILEKIYGKHS